MLHRQQEHQQKGMMSILNLWQEAALPLFSPPLSCDPLRFIDHAASDSHTDAISSHDPWPASVEDQCYKGLLLVEVAYWRCLSLSTSISVCSFNSVLSSISRASGGAVASTVTVSCSAVAVSRMATASLLLHDTSLASMYSQIVVVHGTGCT